MWPECASFLDEGRARLGVDYAHGPAAGGVVTKKMTGVALPSIGSLVSRLSQDSLDRSPPGEFHARGSNEPLSVQTSTEHDLNREGRPRRRGTAPGLLRE